MRCVLVFCIDLEGFGKLTVEIFGKPEVEFTVNGFVGPIFCVIETNVA